MEKDFDVVIIGSGISGGLAADHFVRLGKDVCIIERGGDYFPDRYNHWNEKSVNVPATKRWVTCSQNDPYERTEIKSLNDKPCFKYNMKFGIGGSGAVWSGAAFRFRPNDFRIRSLYGVGEDWPITYEDIEPWYEMAEKEIGVSGADPYGLWPRKSPFPMQPFKQSYLDRVFSKYFESAFPLMPIPCAITSVEYRGRGPCIGARSCVSFCPSEARYHPYQNHLGEALKSSHCTLLKRSLVTRLNMDEKTDRIMSVSVLPENNLPFEIYGKIFILAANTIENTRLLLLSANDRFPSGIANRNGLVGKFFMSTGAFVWTLEFPKPTYPCRGRPITSVCTKFSDGKHRSHMPAFLLEIWNDVWTHGGLYWYIEKQVKAGHWGSTLKKKIEQYMRFIIISAPYEILPQNTNTITLDENDSDSFGLPLPVCNIELTKYEYSIKGFIERTLQETVPWWWWSHVEVKSAGGGINGNHPYGTYRMGRDSTEGVVDQNLRSFDHENLYILGGGSFVTGTCFNPTLTIAALTLKCVNAIKT